MVDAPVGSARRAGFAMLVITLIALIAMCAGALYWTVHAADKAGRADDQPKLDHWTRLAAMSAAVLILTVLILFGVVVRYVTQRLTRYRASSAPTPFESAWTEAGRRLKPEDAPPVEGYEDPDARDDEMKDS